MENYQSEEMDAYRKVKSLLSQVLTAREADEEWGMADGTVKRDCNRGRFMQKKLKIKRNLVNCSPSFTPCIWRAEKQ